MSRDDCVDDAAAYALGALGPADAEAYERHLTACAACRDEVAALRRVTDALPMAAPQCSVPAGLRRRVVRTIRAESRPARVRPRLRPALAGALAIGLAVAAAGILPRGGAGGPRVIDAAVPGSTGTAELRISGGRAELVVRRMPPPRAGRIYEIWLERPGRVLAPSTALFSVTSGGAAVIGVPGGLRGVSEILVTEEPAGGSRTPTGRPVIVAPTT